jgi:5-hydroxyisourate hydrolase
VPAGDHGEPVTMPVRVIDGMYGRPAEGMPVRLERDIDGRWAEQARVLTDGTGRVSRWPGSVTVPGIYRLEFDLDAYFSTLGITPLYPVITMVIRLSNASRRNRISLLVMPSACVSYQEP